MESDRTAHSSPHHRIHTNERANTLCGQLNNCATSKGRILIFDWIRFRRNSVLFRQSCIGKVSIVLGKSWSGKIGTVFTQGRRKRVGKELNAIVPHQRRVHLCGHVLNQFEIVPSSLHHWVVQREFCLDSFAIHPWLDKNRLSIGRVHSNNWRQTFRSHFHFHDHDDAQLSQRGSSIHQLRFVGDHVEVIVGG